MVIQIAIVGSASVQIQASCARRACRALGLHTATARSCMWNRCSSCELSQTGVAKGASVSVWAVWAW